jgi:hypothetical protein
MCVGLDYDPDTNSCVQGNKIYKDIDINSEGVTT